MAPEMLRKQYNAKCDVWSCGVLMHLMVFGKPPFDGSSGKMIRTRILNERIDFRENHFKQVSPMALDLFTKLLEYYPNRRPHAKQLIDHNLFTILTKKSKNEEE